MAFAFLASSSVSALVFDDVEAGAEVGHVAERVLVDEDVGRVEHDRPVRPRVDPFLRRRRHEGRHFLRPELVLDVVNAQAGVLIGREDQLGADEAAGPVLMDVVRPEMAADLQIVLVGGRPGRWRC